MTQVIDDHSIQRAIEKQTMQEIGPNAPKGVFRKFLKDPFGKTVATLMAGIFLILAGIAMQPLFAKPKWSPLGPYPQQTVVTPVKLSDKEVVVVGKKCSEFDTPIAGYRVWISVSPVAGKIVARVDGSGVRNPKAYDKDIPKDKLPLRTVDSITKRPCETLTFGNDFPPEVIKLTKGWLAEKERVIWTINGEETPSDGKRTGVKISWSTGPFEVGK